MTGPEGNSEFCFPRISMFPETNLAYLLRTELTKSHLNNRICQRCGVKTSTLTPSFCYVFNISLSCNINIPSFIGNLWWVLLPGNHLKEIKGEVTILDTRRQDLTRLDNLEKIYSGFYLGYLRDRGSPPKKCPASPPKYCFHYSI